MNLLNSRINRRALGGITLGAATAAGMAKFAIAQDATPEMADEDMEAGQPMLAELDTVGQIDVVANKNSYAVFVAGDQVPGWYSFNVENASENDASMNLAKLPEGVAIGEFTTALFQETSGNVDEMPEWWQDVTLAGGTYVPVGGTNSALLNLDAGQWVLFSNLATSTQSVTTISVFEAEEEEMGDEIGATPVVEEAAATPMVGITTPEGFGSSFTVSVGDGAVNADSTPAEGYNVIGVRNDAGSAANFVMLHSMEEVDQAAAADLAAGWMTGEDSGAELVGGMGALSPDAFGYIELNAEAGTYVGFSSMMNSEGGSQAEDGAVIVFNVG